MVGPHLDHGYSPGEEIFWNVEAMWAKEVVAKKKAAPTKARKDTVNINIVHKYA